MSNVLAPIRAACFATVLLLLLCSLAHAQRDDWHMVSRDLFVKSSFAHGYMHGYEEGFHSGDLDMQMGRMYRDVKRQAKYKKPVGYKSQFGDRDLFDDGYQHGYLVGYTDCFAGRNFRAAQLVKEGRQTTGEDIRADKSYDRAFREGYLSGQKQGLHDGRTSASANNAPFQCEEIALEGKGSEGEATPTYCLAFRKGYQLGYSDGFANQRENGEIFAKK